MPTKVASYLTELGFKQFDLVSEAAIHNSSTAGEFIVIKSLNRMYRYDANSTEDVDDINVLWANNRSELSPGAGRWISVGGSPMKQKRITGSFGSESNTIPLGTTIGTKSEILSVNISNTQILSDKYDLNAAGNAIVFNGQTFASNVEYEVILFTGNTINTPEVDYDTLPATLYQKMMTVNDSTIQLTDGFTIYSKTVSSAVTLNIALPENYTSALGVVTFELYIDMTTASSVLWSDTLTIKWNNSQPVFNEVKKYLLSFRSFDNGATWIGNLEMEWPRT